MSSPDGRWAYTLYDGNGHPFVHALDTPRRTAQSLDVPRLPARGNPWEARLRLIPGRDRLLGVIHGRALATIDTSALAVLPAAAERKPPRRPSADGAEVPAIAAAAVALALVAVSYGARRSIAQRPPASSARAYRSRS